VNIAPIALEGGLLDSESVRAVRAATEEVVRRYDRAYWLRCVEKSELPTELMGALADSGLLGIGLPEELGGAGGGMVEEAVLVEVMAEAGLPQNYVILPAFCRRVVAAHGTPEQRERFIPPTLGAAPNTCFCLTEAESGTNAFAMRTRAVREPGGGWRINGEKTYITGAGTASQTLLVARTGEEDGRARLSMFMLSLPHQGVSMTPMRISVHAPEVQYTVRFDDVVVPGDALVGEEGHGGRTMFGALNPERVLAAAGVIGLGSHVLARGVDYVKSRTPFGRSTGSYQGVQHPLARAYIQLQAARLMTYNAAAAIDRGERSGVGPNSAKLLASEAAFAALDTVIQVGGGASFDADTDIVAFFEAIRLRRITPVNNEQVLNHVAENALGLERSY